MIVIVEGIDRVGKTTLCNALSTRLNLPIYKHNISRIDYPKMDNDNETDKMLQLIELLRMTNSSIIFDRFHLSEYVYGTIERDYDKEHALSNFKLIDDELKFKHIVLILVQPTDVEQSSREHGLSLVKHSEAFDKLFELSDIRKLTCTYDTIDKIVEEVANEYWV